MISWLVFELLLAAVVLLLALLVIPNPMRDGLRRTVRTLFKRAHDSATTPIERELELIAGPQKVIDDSLQQVQDLRGSLLHESNVLLQRLDELHLAEDGYFRLTDDAAADPQSINAQLTVVADKEEEVGIQQAVVDGIQTAVSAALGAVEKARKEIRRLELVVKSDEAKAKATTALDNASRVIAAAQAIGVTGSALQRESDTVQEEFEKAKARIEDAQGTAAEREFKARRQQEQLNEVRQRLEARRAGRTTPESKS